MKNKVIFITGSSSGIGKATALQFAKEGARVVITYHRNSSEAEEVSKECRKLGAADTLVIQLDVTNDASIRSAVKKIIDQFGKIDVLVNNAGVIIWNYLAQLSYDDIAIQIRTNLEGLIKVTKECAPHVTETIINISSTAGLRAHENLTVYCATKFGVRGFTQALAQELPDKKVFAVNPGPTATQMTNFTGVPPEQVAEIILKTAKGEYKKESGADINVMELL